MSDQSVGINASVPTNLAVTDDAGKQMIIASSDGTTTFDWPAIRTYLEAQSCKAPSMASFFVQAVHAAYLEGIEKGKGP